MGGGLLQPWGDLLDHSSPVALNFFCKKKLPSSLSVLAHSQEATSPALLPLLPLIVLAQAPCLLC